MLLNKRSCRRCHPYLPLYSPQVNETDAKLKAMVPAQSRPKECTCAVTEKQPNLNKCLKIGANYFTRSQGKNATE